MKFEHKYLIPESKFPKIKNAMLPYLTHDENAVRNGNTGYTVRSIYFDTPQLRYYFEKIEGMKIRKKIRIRVYDDYTEEKVAFLEIKRKNENYVSKNRSCVLFQNLDKFFSASKVENLILPAEANVSRIDDAKQFLFYFKHENLRPILLITYEREPFVSRFDGNLRITFDKNLRFLATTNYQRIFEESKLQSVLKSKIIIEIKFRRSVPVWLKDLITLHNLQRTSLSKYTICLEADKEISGSLNKKKINSFILKPSRN
ncbi:MAG: hypothetical protein A2315_10510 [Ignavibacteria bacterium RIFOXYB2_FULL_35_12]|nr:MAG: hypothetical protein A2058_09455 [Ignavibacteria bacterium GWA2_36_19]OGU50283.1 MAG: hypothetical protein A2006_05715 [Ignavibacteria bacterium GWC2_35_8]OGU58002.1 MAG: hypothetical protein A2X60_02845 [Ignavibacteria bacterium GWF2_35_20]OGU78039.1 MAG: hypothetical protein A2254_09500 [Ignavibacteria bacterium RIFOXYA2_FULL_35_9]OGU90531.1 MAG: hypothetical protein A2492_06320 [Ignavibacteria bacterium RIFOXYC12_FULL_35_11]OGU91952.1 MAG: hypothetical protein A3K31_17685 [Ignavibac